MLDPLRRDGALPKPDQPERRHASICKQTQLFVGDHVQLVDVPAIFAAQLFQPHIRALGDHDDVGHPRLIGREGFVLVQRGLVVTRIATGRCTSRAEPPHTVRSGLIRILKADVLIAKEALPAKARSAVPVDIRPGRVEAHPDRDVFFFHRVDGQQYRLQIRIDEPVPVLANVVQLRGERVRAEPHGRFQRIQQGADLRRHRRSRGKELGQLRHDTWVGGLLLQVRIVEELTELDESRVSVGQGEQQELFEGGFTMGQTVRLALQPRLNSHLAGKDLLIRKALRKRP